MRVAPVSADLLIKLALAGIGIGVAVWAVRRVSGAVSDAASNAWGAVNDAAQWVADGTKYINPASDQNVVYTTVNQHFWPAGEQTVGTWFYDLLHPEPGPEQTFVGPPNIYAGQNDTTSTTAPVNGSGGAAFGMYPRR